MILKCPNCETCYEIPEDLPPERRKVRCASCQHVWNATLKNQPNPNVPQNDFDDEEIVFKNDEEMATETLVEPEEDPGNSQGSVDDIFAQDLAAGEPPQEPEPKAAPPVAEAGVDNNAFAPPVQADTAPAGNDPDDNFSESAMEKVFSSAMKESDSAIAGFSGEDAESPPIVIGKVKKRYSLMRGNIAAGWAALAIILSGVASFVYLDRITVVRILPGSAATYERLGLPVNVRGLEFDKIKYSWETSSGQPILEVFGDIVNVTSEPLKVPTLVFGLRTKEMVEVYQWAADVRSELLPGGQRTAFSAQIPTPPNSIRDVQVRFAKVR